MSTVAELASRGWWRGGRILAGIVVGLPLVDAKLMAWLLKTTRRLRTLIKYRAKQPSGSESWLCSQTKFWRVRREV